MDTQSGSMFRQREDATMIRRLVAPWGRRTACIIATLVLTVAAAGVGAQETPLRLADDAPDRHIVVPGDTLWGIAGKFIKDPWRWPEIWRLNKEQIKNPHRIYPGDIIVLERDADGRPQLKIAKSFKLEPKQYTQAQKEEISAIPQKIIEPFLSQPLIVEADGLENEARIIATQEERVYLGQGDKAIVANVRDGSELWQVYRPGPAMKDPDNGNILGYEAFHLGTARLLQPGDPAVMEMVQVKQEVGKFDRLIPSGRPPLMNYVPHKPDTRIDAKIISVYGGVGSGGRSSVVALSRGKFDGLEVGNVLGLFRTAKQIEQRNEKGDLETVTVPEERYGLVFVFRVFEHVAYALVMDASRPLALSDTAHNP